MSSETEETDKHTEHAEHDSGQEHNPAQHEAEHGRIPAHNPPHSRHDAADKEKNEEKPEQKHHAETRKERVESHHAKKEQVKHETRYEDASLDYWKIAAIALSAILLVSLYYNYTLGNSTPGNTGAANAASGDSGKVTIDSAEKNAISFINGNLLQPGVTATVKSKSTESGLYKFSLDVNNQSAEVYVSNDGKLLLMGAVKLNTSANTLTGTGTQDASQETTDSNLLASNDPSKGSSNATVTIVEFSDFQCPYCGRYYSQTYKQIDEEYVKTGKVRYVFRDFPLAFHQNAQKASEAAECANDQGKFWEMHNKLFENQQSLEVDDLKKYADDLGLDTTSFDQCLDSGKYEEEVKADLEDGKKYGVTGTPAFFINGKSIVGAQPYESFKKIIDEELAK